MFYIHSPVFLTVKDYNIMEKIKNTVKKFMASCPLLPKQALVFPRLSSGPSLSHAAG